MFLYTPPINGRYQIDISLSFQASVLTMNEILKAERMTYCILSQSIQAIVFTQSNATLELSADQSLRS